MRLLIATGNRGKASEFASALKPRGHQILTLADFPPLDEPEESAETFAGNARIKAEYYFDAFRIDTLADDSGLIVDALDGRPGVLSARLAATDEARIAELLRLLRQVESQSSSPNRSARFKCAICLKTSSRTVQVEGQVEGLIIDVPRGQGGFGYDPIFYYPPLDATFAEIEPEVKNRLSHRARALEELLRQIDAVEDRR